HNFVARGYLRKYLLDPKGKEQTIDLNQGPRFFTSYDYFTEQTVSPEAIVALSDVELLRASKAQVETMMQVGGQVVRDFTIKVMQEAWEEEKRRLHERSNLSAKQRYLNFVQRSPTLLKVVPMQHIASYLGIQPESLSRIRREIIS
ncbi:MAG: Crp/Fnr family transcriptional regulator, partial [Bacteroidota bacterium]